MEHLHATPNLYAHTRPQAQARTGNPGIAHLDKCRGTSCRDLPERGNNVSASVRGLGHMAQFGLAPVRAHIPGADTGLRLAATLDGSIQVCTLFTLVPAID